jgi:hypothetical protein
VGSHLRRYHREIVKGKNSVGTPGNRLIKSGPLQAASTQFGEIVIVIHVNDSE